MNPNDLMLFPPSWRHDRPDPPHPTDEGQWMDVYDDDHASARDAWAHQDFEQWYWDVDR